MNKCPDFIDLPSPSCVYSLSKNCYEVLSSWPPKGLNMVIKPPLTFPSPSVCNPMVCFLSGSSQSFLVQSLSHFSGSLAAVIYFVYSREIKLATNVPVWVECISCIASWRYHCPCTGRQFWYWPTIVCLSHDLPRVIFWWWVWSDVNFIIPVTNWSLKLASPDMVNAIWVFNPVPYSLLNIC